MNPKRCLKPLGFTLFILFYHLIVNGQLQADFSMDQVGGCSPLTIRFYNSTRGASSAAIYSWDFGNGNTSALKNPSGIFIDEETYVVTLTVRDGAQTSQVTKNVTVYKKPVVDFSASLEKGCTPLPVSFTANATADKGSISSYIWDFGDGFTATEYQNKTTHTYITEQNPSVTLSVTDNHGCTSIKIINGIVTVLTGVKADFEADKTFICYETDPVKMNDKSVSGKPLTYLWDFGDGNTSTDKDPVHSFNKKGAYTVTLAIKNTDGCTSQFTKTSYLNVGNFKSEITLPEIICQNSTQTLKNTSSPVPTSSSWTVDNIPVYSYSPTNAQYTFYAAGQHVIQLTNKFGECEQTVSKTIEIKELLQPKGFLTEIPPYCTMPVTVKFTDTTQGATKTEWKFEPYYDNTTVAGKSISHTYTWAGDRWPVLYVANADGCWSSVNQRLSLPLPEVHILATDINYTGGCGAVTKKFSTTGSAEIASVTWNFGDGTTSQEAEPEHTFAPGRYSVTVDYITKTGCKGKNTYSYMIDVYSKPKADFTSLTGTTVCGNSTAVFERKNDPNIFGDYWLVNGINYGNGINTKKEINFNDTGLYTISLIVYNNGCRDTMTRTEYIHVVPSFPLITQVLNTCDNDRLTVTLRQASRYAEKWIWDFGDGTTATYNDDQPVIEHHYPGNGNYQIKLTTKSGTCSNNTYASVTVLKKQQPVLSASKTTFCQDDQLNFKITNLDNNPYNYSTDYYLADFLYNDGTKATDQGYIWYQYSIKGMPYSGQFTYLDKTKENVSVVTQSVIFGCRDTSNVIPIKLTGSKAGFEILNNNQCFGTAINFRDTSNAFNTTITNRRWTFGDGQIATTTSGGIVSHTYLNPGFYNVTLQITDASGCTSTTTYNTQRAYVNGPKAAFYTSETDAHLNSTIYFYNQTNNFNSDNTTYEWHFGDGSTSTDYYTSHSYTAPGTYKTMLIVKGETTGCSDTAYQTITIRNFNAYFQFTSSFINASDCNSALVRFWNTSQNYTHIKWDFGDGVTSDNVEMPSHIYAAPGKYIVKLFVTGHNGLSNTYLDSVIIEKNEVDFSADLSRTCTSKSVTFGSDTGNSSNYLWDFGDGNIVQTTDTFNVHQYKHPGVYTPRLIARRNDGCITFTTMKKTVTIDSLSVSLNHLPAKICAPKEMTFNPGIVNDAGDKSFPKLTYHWDFGTGNLNDTSDQRVPVFQYLQPGNYSVSVRVVSEYGCVKDANATMVAFQGLGALMTGPSAVCEQSTAQFSGATQIAGTPTWKWIFEDGTVVNNQNPPSRNYNTPGDYNIQLIVDNNGCADTISHPLRVNPKPTVVLSERTALLCEGASVNIVASGGSIYSWTPSQGLNTTSGATVEASPPADVLYFVNVTDGNGCSQKDSVKITVAHPFILQMAKEAAICLGEKYQIKSSGGDAYQWISNTSGLSNSNISNPVASPGVSTQYTLIAKDKYNCFSDTATINITVHSLPVVDAGTGGEILSGTPFQLAASGSSDIIDWTWTPSKYLNCIQCPNPIATPMENMIYTVSARNGNGCVASDTVSVKLFCNASRIFIPTAFSPNGDGLNDYFSILGQGISRVNSFRIYDRWGTLIFERTNFSPDNIQAKWDGKYKGEALPTGAYNYVVEMSCNGEKFLRKGTVTLLR